MSGAYTVTARHGEDLDADDHTVLQTIRRTLLGLLDHGFIVDLNTYSGQAVTVWSFREGTEDGPQLVAGLLDALEVIAPEQWEIEVGV